MSSLKAPSMLTEPSPLAGAILDRFAQLAWTTDVGDWLDGLVKVAAQLANCPLTQLYLLDATHTLSLIHI